MASSQYKNFTRSFTWETSSILSLLADHGVEAVFSGHAHTFFYNRFGDMDLYTVPSITFLRPDYSELFQIPPGPEREYGRYDAGKLAHTSQEDFDGGTHFHHFADHGFAFEDLSFIATLLREQLGSGAIDRIVFSSRRRPDLLVKMKKAARVIGVDGAALILQVVFPRVDEGVVCDRDPEVANLAAESLVAAHTVKGAIIFFDTFVDHDRGYYPRHGLLDRRYNFRIGLHVLSHLRDVLRTIGPVIDARTIGSSEGTDAMAIQAGVRNCVLVMSESSEAAPELNAADIAIGDRGRTHWIDLGSGRMHEVQLRPSPANPHRVAINPNPNLEAPGVLRLF